MKYGYIDESGSPGVAMHSNDFFIVSLVIFDTESDAEKSSIAIDNLRIKLGLKPSYEFHYSHNSNISRMGMLRVIPRQDFRVITVSIKKNQIKRTASYARMAELLAHAIEQYAERIEIKMDSNPILYPILYKYLKKKLRESERIKYVSLRELKSHADNLIQLADYVVGISAKKIKNTEKSAELYRSLVKKQLILIDIRD